MSPWGAIIMSLFASAWFEAAIWPSRFNQPLWHLVPLALTGAILLWAVRQIRAGVEGPGGPRVGRIIAIASAAEGVAIPVTATILVNLHQPGLIVPAIAIIVALHFLPIAWAVPFPRFYLLSALLLGVAGVGLTIADPRARTLIVGVGAAMALWSASVTSLAAKAPIKAS